MRVVLALLCGLALLVLGLGAKVSNNVPCLRWKEAENLGFSISKILFISSRRESSLTALCEIILVTSVLVF
jgi:hypothetical protein